MAAFKAQRFLRKIGLGKDDLYFWKQMGKAVLCTYTIWGLAWLWNETSPLGWWTLKPRPKVSTQALNQSVDESQGYNVLTLVLLGEHLSENLS